MLTNAKSSQENRDKQQSTENWSWAKTSRKENEEWRQADKKTTPKEEEKYEKYHADMDNIGEEYKEHHQSQQKETTINRQIMGLIIAATKMNSGKKGWLRRRNPLFLIRAAPQPKKNKIN